jgi:hypothetical protein
MTLHRGTIAALLIAVLCLSGCSSEPEDDGPNVTDLPQPTDGPYVSVAVDNHFHDIHPEDDIEIAADRTFIVKNEGRNLHNFSIPSIDFTKNIRPGKELRFAPIGETLEPGVYSVLCEIHVDQGMVGQFRVTDSG